MLTFVLVLLLVWAGASAVFTLYKAIAGGQTVLTWSLWDLWLLLPYGLFIWAAIVVLDGARP